MSVALLLIIVCFSTAIVRVGAFALELTGMPWDQAKFQALSAFSTAGYTTRESEQIVSHPMRRKIVSVLIVFGNAGIVTSIGTFAGTVMNDGPVDLAIDAGVLVVGMGLVFALARHDGLTGRLRRRVQAWLQRRYDFEPPRSDELLRLDEGYGLTRIVIDDRSPVLGQALSELGLKSWRVQVLGIDRDGDFQPVPRGEDRFLAGDSLVVYGPESAITKVFQPRQRTRLTILGGEDTLPPTNPQAPPGVGAVGVVSAGGTAEEASPLSTAPTQLGDVPLRGSDRGRYVPARRG